MQTIEWIINWFSSHCDGDWEHENQIQIYTTSNPGWTVIINLRDTQLEHLSMNQESFEKSELDWYFVSIKDKKFKASGDLQKLSFLLERFKKIAELNS